jgi:hypothetical protein
MPSGHALTVFTIASALYFAQAAPRGLASLSLFLLAILVSVSRIALGVHWPADILVGAGLGLLCGLLGAKLGHRIPDTRLRLHAWPMRLIALFGAVAIYILTTQQQVFSLHRPLQVVGVSIILLTLLRYLYLSFAGNHAGQTKPPCH